MTDRGSIPGDSDFKQKSIQTPGINYWNFSWYSDELEIDGVDSSVECNFLGFLRGLDM